MTLNSHAQTFLSINASARKRRSDGIDDEKGADHLWSFESHLDWFSSLITRQLPSPRRILTLLRPRLHTEYVWDCTLNGPYHADGEQSDWRTAAEMSSSNREITRESKKKGKRVNVALLKETDYEFSFLFLS